MGITVTATVVLSVLLIVSLVSPVYAASDAVDEDYLNVTDVTVTTNSGAGETVVYLEYEGSLPLKLNTLLFGSDDLQKSLDRII
ncbi:MAG: hypothetical protein SXQ77_04740, partial [Halobacteria archaeon]|nr:hypothetical protein [Halobacteria archaeon]